MGTLLAPTIGGEARWPVKVITPAAASRLVEAWVTGYPLIVRAA
jgi:hypothetical protein